MGVHVWALKATFRRLLSSFFERKVIYQESWVEQNERDISGQIAIDQDVSLTGKVISLLKYFENMTLFQF